MSPPGWTSVQNLLREFERQRILPVEKRYTGLSGNAGTIRLLHAWLLDQGCELRPFPVHPNSGVHENYVSDADLKRIEEPLRAEAVVQMLLGGMDD